MKGEVVYWSWVVCVCMCVCVCMHACIDGVCVCVCVFVSAIAWDVYIHVCMCVLLIQAAFDTVSLTAVLPNITFPDVHVHNLWHLICMWCVINQGMTISCFFVLRLFCLWNGEWIPDLQLWSTQGEGETGYVYYGCSSRLFLWLLLVSGL